MTPERDFEIKWPLVTWQPFEYKTVAFNVFIDNTLDGTQSVVQVLAVLLSISFNHLPWRPQRPALRPVYPPVDPFGNTEYIPLPGPSSPHYALPIHNNENPHFSKTKHRFVRPIRHIKYPKSNLFKYDSSKAFYKNKKEVLRQIQFNNLPWNTLPTYFY